MCVRLHAILSASVFIIRLGRHCGGGIWVCVEVCARVCVQNLRVCEWLGGRDDGEHHCGRQADGDGNE